VYRYERQVRFEDVDVVQIVFFARYFNYCHEAMEAFFSPLPGGYVSLITQRKIGFPAVHAEIDYKSPLRYGDVVDIRVNVEQVGNTSVTFRYEMVNRTSGATAAVVKHVCVVTDLTLLKKVPQMPSDIRAHLEAHRG